MSFEQDLNIDSPHYGISPFDGQAKEEAKLEKSKAGLTEEELNKLAIYKDMAGNPVILNPEIPFNHKWFPEGDIHSAPLGADQSPVIGRAKDKVRVSMMGTKMRTTRRNSLRSAYGIVTAVKSPLDRELIGTSGWFNAEGFNKGSQKKKQGRRSKV